MDDEEGPREIATFGLGCFWGAEAIFRHREGVIATRVGYMGGATPDPTYEEVSTGTTGHTEVVQVIYHPSRVSYETLLAIFWESHDPTRSDGQGDFTGSQYRPVIFFHGPEQESDAVRSRDRLAASGRFSGQPIVTAIEPASRFYPAEEHHQQFYEKCQVRIPLYNEDPGIEE